MFDSQSSLPAGVDVDRLSVVLADVGVLSAGESITDVRSEQIAVGTGFLSDLYRLTVNRGAAESLSVIAKVPTVTDYRLQADALDVYRREVAFYNSIARFSPMRTPRAYIAETDNTSGETVLVMSDLAGLHVPDHITGLPLKQTKAVLGALAEFHAWTASPDRPEVDPALFTTLSERFPKLIFDMAAGVGWPIYCENKRREHPQQVDTLMSRYAELAADRIGALDTDRELSHGDLRVDNIFFDGDEPVFVDFQFVSAATGLVDVAYLLTQGLTQSVRREHDGQLLRFYLDSRPGLPIKTADAVLKYRQAALVLGVLPLGAITGWPSLNERARDLMLTLVERWIDTVVDHEVGLL